MISLVSGFSISLVFLFKKLLFENILYYIFYYFIDFLLYTYIAIYFYVYTTYFPLVFQGYNYSTFMYCCFRVLHLVLNIFWSLLSFLHTSSEKLLLKFYLFSSFLSFGYLFLTKILMIMMMKQHFFEIWSVFLPCLLYGRWILYPVSHGGRLWIPILFLFRKISFFLLLILFAENATFLTAVPTWKSLFQSPYSPAPLSSLDSI